MTTHKILVSVLLLVISFLLTGCDESNPKETINTEWTPKNITISGQTVTYQFGVGNPPEVSLKKEQYTSTKEKLGIDYVTPEIETLIHNIVSNPIFNKLAINCLLLYKDSIQENRITSISDLDINNLLYIDKTTGRKELNLSIINSLIDTLTMVRGNVNQEWGMWTKNDSIPMCIATVNENRNDFDTLLSDLGTTSSLYNAVFRDKWGE